MKGTTWLIWVPTDYESAGDMAAIRKAERNGFDWEYWGARKSQKYKVENKVLATALDGQRSRTTKQVKRIRIEEQEREEKKRLDTMKGKLQVKTKK